MAPVGTEVNVLKGVNLQKLGHLGGAKRGCSRSHFCKNQIGFLQGHSAPSMSIDEKSAAIESVRFANSQ